MAKYEDFLKKAQEENTGTEEIEQASQQQEERQTSTPAQNWEQRYKDMEVAYSRQGQQMGEYRKLVDEYISTPTESQTVEADTTPITSDDIFDNPDEAVRRAVDSHPAILAVKETQEQLAKQQGVALRDAFTLQHPDSQSTWNTPEFANWVNENPTRQELSRRANEFDMAAADALFTMYDSDLKAKEATQEGEADAALAAVGLESSTATVELAPERYSRSEMLEHKIRAKQGDLVAERYVKAHAVAYREALGSGNVRD